MEDDVLIDHVSSVSDDVLLVNPSVEVLEATVEQAPRLDDDATLRILGRKSVLKAAVDDFLLACKLADLVEQETIRIRTGEEVGRNPVLVTDATVVVRITAGSVVEHVYDDDETFVSGVQDAYEASWADGDSFDLRTPARSVLRESLIDNEELGEPMWDDFAALFNHRSHASTDIGEVEIALLAAAKNECQLYHLSKWGEDVRLASKATFSRMKKQLEGTGVIETVRIPVEVGRPRQRLLLTEELRDADFETLVSSVVQ